MELNFRLDVGGEKLIIAVAQDYQTNEVLMVAFMNKEAVKQTLKTKKAHYYSTSRQKQWLKGESSGNVQEVKEIYIDCDADAIIMKVDQKGAACHEGYRSCFFRQLDIEKENIDLDNLEVEETWSLNDNEKELVKLIAKFPSLIEDSAKIRRVHPIAQYCQDLAGAFNRFYKSEQVIGSDVENARLLLVEKARIALKNSLDILGVSAPSIM